MDVLGFKVSKPTETVRAVGVAGKNWKSKVRRILLTAPSDCSGYIEAERNPCNNWYVSVTKVTTDMSHVRND